MCVLSSFCRKFVSGFYRFLTSENIRSKHLKNFECIFCVVISFQPEIIHQFRINICQHRAIQHLLNCLKCAFCPVFVENLYQVSFRFLISENSRSNYLKHFECTFCVVISFQPEVIHQFRINICQQRAI